VCDRHPIRRRSSLNFTSNSPWSFLKHDEDLLQFFLSVSPAVSPAFVDTCWESMVALSRPDESPLSSSSLSSQLSNAFAVLPFCFLAVFGDGRQRLYCARACHRTVSRLLLVKRLSVSSDSSTSSSVSSDTAPTALKSRSRFVASCDKIS
jgi:hypothetical protein